MISAKTVPISRAVNRCFVHDAFPIAILSRRATYLMMKLIPVCLLVGLLAIVVGCADVVSNPIVPPLPKRDSNFLTDTIGTNITIGPSSDGKPWVIVHDWTIPEDQTVTILPGTEIVVDGLWWIDVQGKIVAEGTHTDPIIFTTALIGRDYGQWRGFKLRNPDHGEQSSFKHCIFTYGAYFEIDTLSERGRDAQAYRGMLSVINSNPVIENCVIYYNQNNGVFISGQNALPRVRYNIFLENDASAVRADTLVDLDAIDVSYNCVSENSAISFLMGYDTTRWGLHTQVNSNLDSCDAYFNIELNPLMAFQEDSSWTRSGPPEFDDFSLLSCSPCIDGGPGGGIDVDEDGTRKDMGVVPYVQGIDELRGVVSVASLNPAITYRMSCHVRIDVGQTLTIPAGTRIEATGLYNIEVYGRLLAQGTESAPVHVCPCASVRQDRWGGLRLYQADTLQRRPGEWSQPSQFSYTEFVNYDRIDVEKAGVNFTGCVFDRGFYYGASVNTQSKRLEDSVAFHYCEFLDCGESAVSFVESPGSVRNCFVDRTKGRGISISHGGDLNFVTNCIVQTCSTSGLALDNFSRSTVINNVFRNCGYYGIQLYNQCRPILMNNIVTGCVRYGIHATEQSIPYLDYNDVWGNYTQDNSNRNYLPDTMSVRNGISLNPAFLSATDLHLGAGSPCIDAGNPAPEFNDQTDGSRNDIGAYGGPQGSSIGRFTGPRSDRRFATR